MNLATHQINDEPISPILGLSLSSNDSLFSCCTEDGWIIRRTWPLEVITQRELPNGSLRFVVPLENSNILFLVGGPPSPLYPPNKLIIWDDHQSTVVAELEFRQEIKGVKARRDRLIVVLNNRILLFVLGRGALGIYREGVYHTMNNPKGLLAVSTEIGSFLLAFPGRQPGQVQLVHLPPLSPHPLSEPPTPSHDPSQQPFPAVSIILAHTTSLSALTCTTSGSLIATSSAKGTLIRIWEAATGTMVKELRRGLDQADIFDLKLRSDGGAIAVSSDKGTVHVWNLKITKDELKEKRRSRTVSVGENGHRGSEGSSRSKQFSLLKPYLPKYFSSEWSHSSFRLPPPDTAPPSRLSVLTSSTPTPLADASHTPLTSNEDDFCLCAWIRIEAPDSTIDPSRAPPDLIDQLVVLTKSGRYFRLSIDHAGEVRSGASEGQEKGFGLGKDSSRDCKLIEYRNFAKTDGW